MLEIHLIMSVLIFFTLFGLTLIRSSNNYKSGRWDIYAYPIINVFLTIFIKTSTFKRKIKAGEVLDGNITTYQFSYTEIDIPFALFIVFIVLTMYQFYLIIPENNDKGILNYKNY